MSLKQYLLKHITSDESFERLTCLVFQYLLRSISVKDFRTEVINLLPDIHFAEFKERLRLTGYYHASFKVWAFYCLKHKLGPAKSKKIMRDFLVEPDDFELLRCYKKWEKDYPIKTLQYRAYSFKRIQRQNTRTVKRCSKFVKSFVIRKLRFLTKGSSLTIEDLVSDLVLRCYDSLLIQYPVIESSLHRDNIYRRAIHNNGLNLLYFYNNKGRATMINYDGNFICTNVYYSNGNPDITDDHRLDKMLDHNDDEYYDNLDSEISYKNILKQYKGKDRKFIKLLTGTYNKKFSRYLGTDNDELFDKISTDKYIDYCCDYLELSKYKTYILLNNLKQALGGSL